MRRPAALACPSCGGAVRAWGPGFLDCGSCRTPLAIVGGEEMRQAIEPKAGAAEALAAAVACWLRRGVPRSFRNPAAWDAPRLVFAAFYEVERSYGSGEGSVEVLEAGPAVTMSVAPLDLLPLEALAVHPRQAFEPAAMQRRAVVLDPSLTLDQAVPARQGSTLIEETGRVVYLPLWLLHRRYGRDVYQTLVDGSTGRVLGGRAPIERSARLPGAIAAIYLLGLLAASMPRAGFWYVKALFRIHEVAAIPATLVSLAGLAWLLAWAWARIRFRWELVLEGSASRFVAFNRPERTLPEELRDAILDAAHWLTRRIARS